MIRVFKVQCQIFHAKKEERREYRTFATPKCLAQTSIHSPLYLKYALVFNIFTKSEVKFERAGVGFPQGPGDRWK